jgi:hypothetical protein
VKTRLGAVNVASSACQSTPATIARSSAEEVVVDLNVRPSREPAGFDRHLWEQRWARATLCDGRCWTRTPSRAMADTSYDPESLSQIEIRSIDYAPP